MANKTISASTAKTYASCINKLYTAGFKDDDFKNNPTTIAEWIVKHASPTNNPGSIISNLCAASYKSKSLGTTTDVYKKHIDSLRESKEDKQISQTLAEPRSDKFLEWPEVLKLHDKAKETLTSENYVLYCLYTLQPPVRADYFDMRVMSFNHWRKLPEDSTKDINALLYVDDYEPICFIFNTYKTSATYGMLTFHIEKQLATILQQYLQETKPKLLDRLLPTINSQNTLVVRIKRIFKKLANKEMSIGLLRHSFIQNFLSTKRTIREKVQVAQRMMHSTNMQERYDILESNEN